MKFKLSQSQWQSIGKQAGWLNKPTCKKCKKPLKLTNDKKCSLCGEDHKELQQELPIRLPDEKKPIINTNPLGNPSYKGTNKLDLTKALPHLRNKI